MTLQNLIVDSVDSVSVDNALTGVGRIRVKNVCTPHTTLLYYSPTPHQCHNKLLL